MNKLFQELHQQTSIITLTPLTFTFNALSLLSGHFQPSYWVSGKILELFPTSDHYRTYVGGFRLHLICRTRMQSPLRQQFRPFKGRILPGY